MSAVTRPRGPLPARVYWTRRIVLLSVALLLVVTTSSLLTRGSDGSSGEEPEANQAAGTPTSTGSGSPAPTTSAQPKPKKQVNMPPALPEPDGPCAAGDVVVKAALERVHAGGAIQIPLVLRGKAAACTFHVSNKTVVAKVISGDDNIWSTTQCKVVPEQDVVVRSGSDTTVILTWHGRRSDEDCSHTTRWAVPGWYHVISATLGGEPSDTQFELTAPPRPTVTRTAKPKQKKAQAQPSGAVEPNR